MGGGHVFGARLGFAEGGFLTVQQFVQLRARADDVAAGEFIENLLRLLALDAEPTLKLHWAGVLFGADQFNLAAHEVKVVAGRVLRVRARAGMREAKRGQMLHGGGEFRRVAELILHPLHYGREVKRGATAHRLGERLAPQRACGQRLFPGITRPFISTRLSRQSAIRG